MSSAFFGRKGFSFFDCFYGVTWWCGFLTGAVRGLGFLGGGLSDLFFSRILREGKRQGFSKRFGGLRLGGLDLRGGGGRRRAEAGSVPTATLHYIRSGGPGVSFLSFFLACFLSFLFPFLSFPCSRGWVYICVRMYVLRVSDFHITFFFPIPSLCLFGWGGFFFFSCGARKSVSSCLILGLALFLFLFFTSFGVWISARCISGVMFFS